MLNVEINFDNSFQKLPAFLYEHVVPAPLKDPTLIHVTGLKKELGLESLSDSILQKWLNGETRFNNDQRIATRYAGHQFGVFAGQLGDGRAISLGEILDADGKRWEIQTKGSGKTPFSRTGDGRAVIRSSVREYLCSEAMYGLGIPSSRVLAIIIGQDKVYRETIERSAIIARVFPSNIRFGHFEMCYHYNQKVVLNDLIEYTRYTFFGGIPVKEMLEQIIDKTAMLMAHWQTVGFCHGVMNTDNMSILGITIDYGPFGFLEDTTLSHVCNHSDHQGRYAYNSQPSVAAWNLEKLLVCFSNHLPKEKLINLLDRFSVLFLSHYQKLWQRKIGLITLEADDLSLFDSLLQMLNKLSIDYTFFFRQLCKYKINQLDSLSELWNYYEKNEELTLWLSLYDQRLKRELSDDIKRQMEMKSVNPKYVLRNYIAQEIIEEAEKGGSEKLKSWLEILYSPFAEHLEYESYSKPTPTEKKNYSVSCSS
jgi:uncharacterized protein YdiU (UPF0061 family)